MEIDIEYHPFEPFLPKEAKILMLGTFPPKSERWSMEFYYPNKINDMWRIIGGVFFNDKEHFLNKNSDSIFNLPLIKDFLSEVGIALYDTAYAVRRLKDNASDKYLEIVTPINLKNILSKIPECKAIITAGEKATNTLCEILECPSPTVGKFTDTIYLNRKLRIYRLPSSSRAYPRSLALKTLDYDKAFKDIGIKL